MRELALILPASNIIAETKATPIGEKLQVFVLGAYTNAASALLLDPSEAYKNGDRAD